MKLIIDRFEGDFAVVELEDMSTVNIPRVLVPDGKEGDIVTIEVSEDKDRHERIEKLADSLFK